MFRLKFYLKNSYLYCLKFTVDKLSLYVKIINKLNTVLIKSGGGDRPCEARQPDLFQGANSGGLSER